MCSVEFVMSNMQPVPWLDPIIEHGHHHHSLKSNVSSSMLQTQEIRKKPLVCTWPASSVLTMDRKFSYTLE